MSVLFLLESEAIEEHKNFNIRKSAFSMNECHLFLCILDYKSQFDKHSLEYITEIYIHIQMTVTLCL